jgi:hypothetical protein
MKRATTLLLALLASGLIAAGCGGDDENTTGAGGSGTESMQSQEGSTAGATTDAAQLRADLTHLLEEHVYLAGITVKNGVDNGLDSGEFEAASDTLDRNSQALADAFTGLYGDDAGEQFLTLWRNHIGFFVDYTKARAEGDQQAARSAQQDLDGYRKEFGTFINSAVPSLPADAVAEDLDSHVKSLSAAIDAVVAGDGDAFEKLREAAGHMPQTATTLAGGIASEQGEEFSGSVDASASELRGTLTAALTEHVYLAGITISQGVADGTDSDGFDAAAAELDENSMDLAGAIGSVYGDEARKDFLELWREHIGFFVEYTEARAGGDEQAAMQAEEKLDGYRSGFGAFIGSANPELPADAVAAELEPHVESVLAAIDRVVEGEAEAFEALREAASHMPGTAETLADGIAKQNPEQFPSS